MQSGLILLCLAYVLSQFFRAFLAVLSTLLETDLGAGPDTLAFASGLWFLSFAAMQLPVGWALDRIGPRRTASVLLFLGGGGGAALFALAQSPAHISTAMFLIGIGCSPVLMASYYIFAREYPPAKFATLAALMLGAGSVGNLVASYPTALAAELFGWRGTLAGLAVISVIVAGGIALTVRDPEAVESDSRGSLLDLLRMPVLWPILILLFMNYAPAGALRGLWIGPYLRDVYGLDTGQIGQATLLLGAAMIIGTFIAGPLDRVFGTRKWVILGLNVGGSAACLALGVWANAGLVPVLILITLIGLFGGCFPVMLALGRSFIPAHLVGRGVTLMNLFGIGGVGVMQFVTGRLHSTTATDPVFLPYQVIFLTLGGLLALCTVIFLTSRDSVN